MAQDIEVTITHAITTQLDIPAEAQVRSIKIGEQQFHAQPQGLDLSAIVKLLDQQGINLGELQIKDVMNIIAGIVGSAGGGGWLQLVQIALPIVAGLLQKKD